MLSDASREGWTIISDTSWAGYEEIPRLIILGYTRLLDEVEAQSASQPDVIFVQAGVGGLLAATACWADWRYGKQRPSIVAVEPLSAGCVQASVRANAPTVVGGPFETIMGGLRCGEMSPIAFEVIRSIVDGYIAIEDQWAREAMRRLALPGGADPQIEAGASGAASLAGLLAPLGDPAADELREALKLSGESRVLVIATEGVTDPDSFPEVLNEGS